MQGRHMLSITFLDHWLRRDSRVKLDRVVVVVVVHYAQNSGDGIMLSALSDKVSMVDKVDTEPVSVVAATLTFSQP